MKGRTISFASASQGRDTNKKKQQRHRDAETSFDRVDGNVGRKKKKKYEEEEDEEDEEDNSEEEEEYENSERSDSEYDSPYEELEEEENPEKKTIEKICKVLLKKKKVFYKKSYFTFHSPLYTASSIDTHSAYKYESFNE